MLQLSKVLDIKHFAQSSQVAIFPIENVATKNRIALNFSMYSLARITL